MRLLCKMFGHQPMENGWWGDIPYIKIRGGYVDNIGRVHGTAYHECRRCETEYLAGRLHFNTPAITKALNNGKASATQ